MKNIVITDKDIPLELFKESVIVNLNNIKYSACTGNYTCLKKRSPCRYHDDISVINQWIGEASLIILVTHIYCGCFDTPLKSFIERNIASYEPYYTTVDGITCHASLAQQSKKILLIGYGDISEQEQKMLMNYLHDSLLGYSISSINTYFCTEEELDNSLKTFGGVDRG